MTHQPTDIDVVVRPLHERSRVGEPLQSCGLESIQIRDKLTSAGRGKLALEPRIGLPAIVACGHERKPRSSVYRVAAESSL